jgi:polyprenyldihydroxybenzoate methyltransferase/3-demethylubiquinol 3-O-methyltransferase
MVGMSDVAGYAVRCAFLFCSLPPIGLNVSLPFSRSQGRVRVSNLSLTTHSEPRATRREHARHRSSSENIGIIPMRQAAVDPGLAAPSFHHASAEILVQDPKQFDLVCSIEVVEHVDNPDAFEVGCGARQGLSTHCLPAGSIFIDLRLFPIFIASSLVDTFSSQQLHERRSLISPPWQPRTCSALSSLAHTFSKFVNSDELVGFFVKAVTEGARPWISRTYAHGLPTHVEAEVRGVVYVPWRGKWGLALGR